MGYNSTSTSQLTISTGAKTATVGSGLSYLPNDRVRFTYRDDIWMEGYVTSYSSTTMAVIIDAVSGAGTYWKWVVELGLLTTELEGIQGVTGIQGVRGMTGAQGLQGATGVAVGVLGATGIQGITGATGVKGITGANGVVGLQGVTGANGIIGLQGVTGAKGTQGDQGITGIVPGNLSAGTLILTDLSAAGQTGIPGQVAYDGTHFYGCDSTFVWLQLDNTI